MTFGLVHGAWHGGWCWERVVPLLEAAGHDAVAVDLPADDPSAGLSRYAEVVDEALGAAGDVVLVGHSLGGCTIPLVARRRPVRRLVFLCAPLPLPGLSLRERARRDGDCFLPEFAVASTETREDGCTYWTDHELVRELLYHDCPPADVEAALARLRPQSPAAPTERWPADLELGGELVSIVGSDERAISPDWSRRMSREQLGVEPVELPSGHSPFYACPDDLVEVLLRDL